MAYTTPTDAERPILFRLCKQGASFTIWSQIYPYFDRWVQAFLDAAPLATDSETGGLALDDSDLRLLLNCRSAFAKALTRLRRGERDVFKWMGYGTGLGFFCEAFRAVEAWQALETRHQSWSPRCPLMETPSWPEIRARQTALVFASVNGGAALQERDLNMPAVIRDMREINGELDVGAPVFIALKSTANTLPSVPDPRDALLIKTGERVPCYGIWEPVKANLTKGPMRLFKKRVIPADGKFEIDGCMNYLHAGSPAPSIAFEGDGLSGEGRSTVWRLLWRDDRYVDGLIPEEEHEYIFCEPPVGSTNSAQQAQPTDGPTVGRGD